MSNLSLEAQDSLHPNSPEEARRDAPFIFLNNAFTRLHESALTLGDEIIQFPNYVGVVLTRDETTSVVSALTHYQAEMTEPEEFIRTLQELKNISYYSGAIFRFRFRLYERKTSTWRVGLSIGAKSGGLLGARIIKDISGASFSIDTGDVAEPFLKRPVDRLKEMDFINAVRRIATTRHQDAQELLHSIPEYV